MQKLSRFTGLASTRASVPNNPSRLNFAAAKSGKQKQKQNKRSAKTK